MKEQYDFTIHFYVAKTKCHIFMMQFIFFLQLILELPVNFWQSSWKFW